MTKVEEYHQITLTEYMQWKQEIQERLNQSANNFVNIGYLLKKIRDTKAYEQDGYETLTEWAKATYNLTAPSVSRFIKINDEYSEEGYSRLLKREYEGYGYNQLYEMLAIPEADRTAITPATTVQEIREVKRFEKEYAKAEEPEAAAVDKDFEQVVRILFEDKHVTISMVLDGTYTDKMALREIQDVLMPNGGRNVRAGTMMAFLNKDEVKLKRFAAGTETMEWGEFLQKVVPILETMAAVETVVETVEEIVENAPEQKDFDIEIPEENQQETEPEEQENEQTEHQEPEEKAEQSEAEREETEPEEASKAGETSPEETAEAAAATGPEPVEKIPAEDVEVVETVEEGYSIEMMLNSLKMIRTDITHHNWDGAIDELEGLLDDVKCARMIDEEKAAGGS